MDPLDQVLEGLSHCFEQPTPDNLQGLFDEPFLAQMPLPDLEDLFARLGRDLGSCTGQEITSRLSERSASVCWSFEHGYWMDGMLTVNGADPPKISILRFGLPSQRSDSWPQAEEQTRSLSDHVSFEIRDLSMQRTLASVNPTMRLGVGSVSKLLILGCLLDELGSQTRQWDDSLTLGEEDRSSGSGLLHNWPAGSPLTLHTAAVLLMSQSDNTAADLLLRHLGRRAVEAFMEKLSIGDAQARNPFFSTRGLFRLMGSPEEERERYRKATPDDRNRALVEAESKTTAVYDDVMGVWPDGFDWYLSAGEVCTVLDHLRLQLLESQVARDIVGMNDGGMASNEWRFAGYKGGSSPGRMGLAMLLEDDRQHWTAACLVVNTKPQDLDGEACVRLMRRATDLALTVENRQAGSPEQ